jgi:hypothetical protein
MLLAQLTACAFLRAWFSAGSRIEMRIAMIPMTTSSSTRVNAGRVVARRGRNGRVQGMDEMIPSGDNITPIESPM